MKSKTFLSAESNVQSFLVAILFGVAIFSMIQVIIFMITLFHKMDINSIAVAFR